MRRAPSRIAETLAVGASVLVHCRHSTLPSAAKAPYTAHERLYPSGQGLCGSTCTKHLDDCHHGHESHESLRRSQRSQRRAGAVPGCQPYRLPAAGLSTTGHSTHDTRSCPTGRGCELTGAAGVLIYGKHGWPELPICRGEEISGCMRSHQPTVLTASGDTATATTVVKAAVAVQVRHATL